MDYLIGFALLFGALVLALVYFFIVMMKRSTGSTDTPATTSLDYDELAEKMYANCGEALPGTDTVIDCADLRAAAVDACEVKGPGAGGDACSEGFSEDAIGCCVPVFEASLAERIGPVVQGIAVAVAMDKLTSFARKGGVKLGAKAARGVGRFAVRMGVKAGAKLATFGAKMSMKSAAGPAGWALMVFDIFSLGLDMWDPKGFNNFTPNVANLMQTRNGYEFEFYKMVRQNFQQNAAESDTFVYPPLYPIDLVFPTEYNRAQDAAMATLFGEIVDGLIEEHSFALIEALESMDVADPDATSEGEGHTFNALDAMVDQKMRVMHLKRDMLLFQELKNALPPGKRQYMHFYSRLSAPGRCGVSLSEAGVQWWNQQHHEKWLAGVEGENEPPLLAVYTDRFGVPNPLVWPPETAPELDPKTQEAFAERFKLGPPMTQYRLVERAALMSPLGGSLYKTCHTEVEGLEGTPQGWDQEHRMCKFGCKFCLDKVKLGYLPTAINYRYPRDEEKHKEQFGPYPIDEPLPEGALELVEVDSYDDCHMSDWKMFSEMVAGTTVDREVTNWVNDAARKWFGGGKKNHPCKKAGYEG